MLNSIGGLVLSLVLGVAVFYALVIHSFFNLPQYFWHSEWWVKCLLILFAVGGWCSVAEVDYE